MHTYFEDLNKLLGASRTLDEPVQESNVDLNGKLMILGSRPGMGKTCLALSIASHPENKTLYITLKDTTKDILKKLISSRSEVEADKFRISDDNTAYMPLPTEVETARLKEAEKALKKYPIVYNPKSIAVEDLFDEITEKQAKGQISEIDSIVIDYVQMLNTRKQCQNRYEEMCEVSKVLKREALSRNIPIIALSQLNRKVDERQGHVPIISDLRDSGSLEDEADQVWLLHRRDYYDPLDKPWQATLIIAKNTSGSAANVTLTFMKECCEFANYMPIDVQL